MDDLEIQSIIAAEIADAVSHIDDDVGPDRAKAINYYFGRSFDPRLRAGGDRHIAIAMRKKGKSGALREPLWFESPERGAGGASPVKQLLYKPLSVSRAHPSLAHHLRFAQSAALAARRMAAHPSHPVRSPALRPGRPLHGRRGQHHSRRRTRTVRARLGLAVTGHGLEGGEGPVRAAKVFVGGHGPYLGAVATRV